MDDKFDKNKSLVGWCVAAELLRFVPDGINPEDATKRWNDVSFTTGNLCRDNGTLRG